MPLAFTLVVPGDPETRTGGFLYDKRIAEALIAQGWPVALEALPAGFPFPDDAARTAAESLLAGLPEGAVAVIDGLALGVLPDLIAREAKRLRLVALVHHPLALETGLGAEQARALFQSERDALAQVRGAIVTSPTTVEALADYGLPPEKIHAVLPGVDPAPLAPGSGGGPLTLLCVASLTPRKGHSLLLEALAGLTHRAWHLTCVGSPDHDPATAAALKAQCRALGLGDRVTWTGELIGDALEACYWSADVFVLASHYEGYGMVLSEAIMRGLPIVATAGGAVAQTVPAEAGLLTPPGNREALASALAEVLDDPARRETLAAGARQAREGLPDWPQAGALFGAALESLLA